MIKKLTILFILPFLLGCEKEIDVKLPDFQPKMVANCFINPDTSVYVFLSDNVDILKNELPAIVQGASIELFENDLLVDELQEFRIPNWSWRDTTLVLYTSSFRPMVGNTYSIHLKHPDYPTAIASTNIPIQTSEFAISLSEPTIARYEQVYDYENDVLVELPRTIEYTATIKIKDAPGKNFYEVAVLGQNYQVTYDEFNNPVPNYQLYESRFFSNNIIFDAENEGDIKGDAGEVFNDDLFENQEYEFSISFTVYVGLFSDYELFDQGFFIDIRSLSEDYYQYKLTSRLQKGILQDPFAEPVQIYSNVQNGIGIFGGYNVERFEFSLEEFIPVD